VIASRRRFLGLFAAPAIVRVGSLMPVSVLAPEPFSTANMVWKATIRPTQLIIPPRLEAAAFRAIIMPMLREQFDEAFARAA
jgi:hypothetical protein